MKIFLCTTPTYQHNFEQQFVSWNQFFSFFSKTSRAPLYQTFDSTWWMLDRIVNRMLINLWSSPFFLRNWTRFEKKGEFLFSSSRNNGRKEFYDRLYSSPDVKKNFHSAGRQWMNLPWISMISYAQRMRVYIYIYTYLLSLSLSFNFSYFDSSQKEEEKEDTNLFDFNYPSPPISRQRIFSSWEVRQRESFQLLPWKLDGQINY